jgi:preprotein translocase subunit SecA
MLKRFVKMFAGDPHKRDIEKYADLVTEINALEPEYEKLSAEALRAKTEEFRAALRTRLQGVEDEERRKRIEQETLEDLLPEAFAAVREASKRTIGLRHYDVQMIGGSTLHQGKIVEMRTGEGKTLVATLPIYMNALTGRGVHLITVNDYLARRDARWMAPIYNALGLTVGVLQMAARTENGKKAFLVDQEVESPHEDQHHLRMAPRAEAYAADITYGTNSEFGFDFLRDNMTMRMDDRVQRGHYYAIIDEVDNVLIDEARTPLIISGPAQDEAEWYVKMAQVVRQLKPEDYEVNEKDRNISLTEVGEVHVEEIMGMALRDPDRPEDVTPEQARMLGYLEQALRAQFIFRRNKDYLVQGGKVVIIDEFTGRLMPGRRWSDGLHQAVEAKEGVKVESESVTYATITIQNYFRMYQKLAGMTGTALTEAEEFSKIYKLDVLPLPTNLEYQALRTESGLVEVEGRDESGYRYQYYARREDPLKTPVYWRRKDYPDVVYRTQEAKLRAIAQEILHYHVQGRPMLVGTTSVELSEMVSSRLRAEPLRRLALVLLLRRTWLQTHNREEDGRQITELQFLNQPLERLEIPDMRKMGRELGISFNLEEDANLDRLIESLQLSPEDKPRLAAVLQSGVPHEVLNARKHTEESQIIAGAGAFGAVTIATNMAGRGVDIKLGGELAEELLSTVNRVIARSGRYDNPYEMTMEERRQALRDMSPDEYGIYETEVQYFYQHLQDMERVRELGGLHVIGSERHEARRIDNQLRGRAARQGDPGSSRFYLSMEDELMRLFGGGQADALMQRLKIDDALPLEVGLVGRLVEQSQSRVEGANFDVRKHLLEYDDVLNTQRTKIYTQRNRIFEKEDLSEDVTDMLRTEVTRRVPEALDDEEGPWKLLAWLEQIQPPLKARGKTFPSYTFRLLSDYILNGKNGSGQRLVFERQPAAADRDEARADLIAIARQALEAEHEHLFRTVHNLLDSAEERLESQVSERMESLDMFFEGLELEDEEGEDVPAARPADRLAELQALVHMPVRLSPEQQRALARDPHAIEDEVRAQVRGAIFTQAIVRLIGSVERRLEESLELAADKLKVASWDEVADQVLDRLEETLNKRYERFLGDNGQIIRDLDAALAKRESRLDREALLDLLRLLPEGVRTAFDKRTHRRVWQRTTRLNFMYFAGTLIDKREPEDVAAEVLRHLEEAQAAIRQAWGEAEILRLGNTPLSELDESLLHLAGTNGQDVDGATLGSLAGEVRQTAVHELGRRALTNLYRQLLLSVVTELWVDYLTQMEALRVSIGLEAYGQRDPLVQYKNRAFELFQNLMANMRLGVITRMFVYRPRDMESVQATVSTVPAEAPALAAGDAEPAQKALPESSPQPAAQANRPADSQEKVSTSKKRRRSRR